MELVKLKLVKSLIYINVWIGRKLMLYQAKYSLEQEIEEAVQKESIDIRKQSSRFRNIWLHDQEIIDRRWSECQGCEYLIKATNQCKKCGCFMKVKTKVATARCPVGKWEKEYDFIKGEAVNGLKAAT